MPIKKIETKPARYVYDLKDGKKQYFKTGSRKGEPKMKLKTKAKYKTELDTAAIFNLLDMSDIIVIEKQGIRPGNSAMSSASTMIGYGKLLALAELSEAFIYIIQPQVWKKHFGLNLNQLERKKLTSTEYKKLSIPIAYEKSGIRTSKDGEADAIVIGYYFIEELLQTYIKDAKIIS